MTSKFRITVVIVFALTCSIRSARAADPAPRPAPFAIEVVDEQTGRGVPLIELTTVSNVRYVTDSAGLIAVDDPSLFGHEVFFSVKGHGYDYPADGFGIRGVRLKPEVGGAAKVKVKRVNIAERLYRVTGEGIYRDSVMIGRNAPVKWPVLNAEVTGQDSAQQAVYQGKVYWFFGDTNRQRYPLGHFWMSGATSELPQNGGLDPSVGIDLTYFKGDDGFARGTFPPEGGHPVWGGGYFVLPDDQGRDRLVCAAGVIAEGMKTVGRRLCVWDDGRAIFDTLKEFPPDAPLYPSGHPLRVESSGARFVYFGGCESNVRVRDDWKCWQDLSTYEGFTCLVPGARYEKAATKLERDAQGKLVWAWKTDTATLSSEQVKALVDAGAMKPDEVWFRPLDVETKKPLVLGMGSVRWNAFRKRYVMIAGELGGTTSMVGEIWYSEANAPQGPWKWARKVVTHDKYSFYNPVHHDFFDQDGGKTIYFQGTYTATFSRNDGNVTPRYEYNQIVYKLNLGDDRLKLPE